MSGVRTRRRTARGLATILVAAMLTLSGCAQVDELLGNDTGATIPEDFDITGRTFSIAAKPTAENELIARMLVAVLEDRGALVAFRVLDDPRQALLDGTIDIYPEYDGTAWQVHNGREGDLPNLETLRGVDNGLGITWTDVAPFSNSYDLVTAAGAGDADAIRDALGAGGTVCHDAVFGADPAGLERLRSALVEQPGVQFVERNSGEVIAGAADGSCTVGQVLATDARLVAFDLDRVELVTFDRFRPGFSWRTVMLGSDPDAMLDVAEAVLVGLDADTMARLNAQVDLEQRPAAEVARDHLVSIGLLDG